MATNDHDLETEQQAVKMMHHPIEVAVYNSVRFDAIIWPPVHEVVDRHVPRHLLLVRLGDLLCADLEDDLGCHFGRAL